MTDQPKPKRPRKPEPKEAVAARQRALVEARKAQGLKRVANLYARPEDHQAIRDFVKTLHSPKAGKD
jgi:hypothetical protein